MKQIKQGKPIYKLKSQSPVEDLSAYLGQTTTFTLDTPLRVKPNNIVALTVPTWAPGLRDQPERQHQVAGEPQEGQVQRHRRTSSPGRRRTPSASQRAYGCTYNTARLLYSATVVADPNQKPAKPPKKKK